MNRKLLKVFLPVYLLFNVVCFAGVNPKNGNFYVGYTDFVFSNSPMKLQISRTYNSKIADIGWFGVGWGSDYETHLITLPGGGVLMFNNGSGKRDVQKPKEWDMQDISLAIDELVTAMKTEGKLTTPDEILNMKSKLLNDQELRHTYWKKYLNKGMVKNRVITPGTKLYSSCGCGGFEYIVATAEGFNRSNSNGNTEFFNLDGKLIKIEDSNGNSLHFEFSDSLFIKKISDNSGNFLLIDVNKNGRIIQVTDQKNRLAKYEYDLKNNLVYSCDIGANIYRFEYDGNSNLTSIIYMDGLRMGVEYNKSGFATKVVNRDGSSTEYQYPNVSDTEYGSVVIQRNKKDSIINKESRWYSLKTDAIGTSWVWRLSLIINDKDSCVQIFNEAHHRIDTLYKNKETYKYSYDIKGTLLKTCDISGRCADITISDNLLKTIGVESRIYNFSYDEKKKALSITTPSGTSLQCPFKFLKSAPSAELDELERWFKALSYTYLTDNIDNLWSR
jgi:YD repeat-containing protein